MTRRDFVVTLTVIVIIRHIDKGLPLDSTLFDKFVVAEQSWECPGPL